jgi:tRNA (mo5U34)-methyltransferase
VQDEIQQKINSVKWYHRYEVLPGYWTPGIHPWNAKATMDSMGMAEDLIGKTALDVGTWDGVLAFEIERRGADVYAVDVQDPDCTAFNTAKELRQSKVKYTQLSVYDLHKAFPDTKFDIITYFGVYYHLKHPILGFEALAEALADDGKLYFEGELWIKYSENYHGQPSTLNNEELATSDVPLSLCYTGDFKGVSNWFVPNFTCLKGWLEAAGLVITSAEFGVSEDKPYPWQRIYAIAQKAKHLEILEETGIFEKNLTMAAKSWDQTSKLRQHRKQSTAVDFHIPVKSVVEEPVPVPTPSVHKWGRFLKRFIGK